MTDQNPPIRYPTTRWLIAMTSLVVAWDLLVMLHVVLQIQQSPFFAGLFIIAMAYSAMLWFQADRRARRLSYGLDQEALIFAAWPVVLPFYIYRSRGFRQGTRFLLGVLGVFILCILPALTVGIGVTVLRYARP